LNPKFLPGSHTSDFLLPIIALFTVFLGSAIEACGQRGSKSCVPPPGLNEVLTSHPTADAYDALAGYFGQRNEYSCAIAAFRSSLRLTPNSWKTRYYLALAYLASGDPTQAARELRISLKLNPDQPEAHLSLGAALSQLHETDAAIAEFRKVLQNDPQSITALDWLSKAYISEKRYSAAIAVLEDAPIDEALEMDLVLAYSQDGESSKAMAVLSQMAKDRPESAVPHSGLASVDMQQRRFEDAASEFREALRLNPQDNGVRVSYLKVLIILSEFKTALPIAEDYLARHQEDFEAYYLNGVILRELGENSRAKELFLRAVRLQPADYAARYNLGVVLAKAGDPVAARKQLEKALHLDPTSTEARFQLASVFRSLALPEEAQKELTIYQSEMADRAQREVAAAQAHQAKELLKKGDAQAAVDLYREAIGADPKNSRLLYDLAMAFGRNADHGNERHALEKAIAIDPAFAAAHNQLGFLALQSGRADLAEAEFKSAISLNRNYAEAQNNLGVLYGQRGNDREAERLFRQAVDSDPRYTQALVNLAAVLAAESHYSEAESDLENAIRIAPDDQLARRLLDEIQAHKRIQSETPH
jgi:tetratricopeptide (TPR) repeat protein